MTGIKPHTLLYDTIIKLLHRDIIIEILQRLTDNETAEYVVKTILNSPFVELITPFYHFNLITEKRNGGRRCKKTGEKVESAGEGGECRIDFQCNRKTGGACEKRAVSADEQEEKREI